MICWAVALGGYIVLLFVGNSQPISMQRGGQSAWAEFWQQVEATPLPGSTPTEPMPEKPKPPPPPEPIPREMAERVIRISALVNHADVLVPRLRQSIRVSPWPLDSMRDLEIGESRLVAPPDVPPGFTWPESGGQPLRMLAQLRMSDVAPLDERELLPERGWLYFFYADSMRPAPTGVDLSERAPWRVVYYDGSARALERVDPPESLEDKYPPCSVRFWKEWTLPSLAEEPKLIWDQEILYHYSDLCRALTGRPKENGWHHLLGYAQNLTDPMLPACDDASADVGADEWILLFQIDPDSLETTGAQPEPGFLPWLNLGTSNRLYYWIREGDLLRRDFTRVCVQWQGDYVDDDPYDAYDPYETDDEGD